MGSFLLAQKLYIQNYILIYILYICTFFLSFFFCGIFADHITFTLDKAMLNRRGYTPDISHGVLVQMAEHRKELEKTTKPIMDTLRSYQDLPPVIS